MVIAMKESTDPSRDKKYKLLKEILETNDIPHKCLLTFLLDYTSSTSVEGFYNGEHVITKINGEFYDRNGKLDKFKLEGYKPFEAYGYNHFITSFTELSDNSKSILKDYFHED